MRSALIIGLLMWVAGCQSSPTAAPEDAVSLMDAVTLWRDGAVDAAVAGYVHAAEAAGSDLDLVLFDLTEAQFGGLPQAERDLLLKEWIATSDDLRGLTSDVYQAGAQAGGAIAARHNAAIERVGRAHAESGRALMATSTGAAILRGLARRTTEP